MKIKIAIAEDKQRLADSVREKLQLFADEIDYRFSATNGRLLIDKLAEDHLVDVILMDIEMPEMDGIEATRYISERYPQIKIIMLTVFDDDQKIFDSIQAGAMGYLLKDVSAQSLFDSIKMICAGGAPMSPPIAAKSLALLRNPERITSEKSDDFGLSEREIVILEQISQGLGYKEIADNLFISPFTVRKHIENCYRKLQVNNKIRAVKKAAQHKLI
ncbi:MAG: response regulator transcription factor [Calditrichaeota bacterium]|nr:response regulator transcription factor [Calditrichota bacterium]